MKKYTVGIIGNGRFGDMLYKTFTRYGSDRFDVSVFSRKVPTSEFKIKNSKFKILEEVCSSDIVIPSVPISVFEEQIVAIKDLVPESSLVVDVCSVSMHPAKVMIDNLNCDLLSTHPMFGPDSTQDSTFYEDLKFIFHELRISDSEKSKAFLDFWKSLGCDLRELTPEEHDKQAAYTHAFAFLIGKLGIKLEVRRNDISTKGFEGVLYNQEAVENDTGQLFEDIMMYNPYVREMRKKMMKALVEIDEALK